MRLSLQLAVDKKLNLLPFNYQYPVSSWIYSRMAAADPEFSAWLHDRGYSLKKKNFKLFTFSDFRLLKYKVRNDRLSILSPAAQIRLSFCVDQAAEKFIIGLFQDQSFEIGDRKSRARFYVQTVESLPDPDFSRQCRFKCLSPLCVAKPVDRNGRLTAHYLAPGDPDYPKYFFDHLFRKYLAARPYLQGRNNMPDTPRQGEQKLEILSTPRSRLVTVKAGTAQETRLRGYSCHFKIIAPPELIRLGYQAGFGEKNSLGFGCAEVMDGEL